MMLSRRSLLLAVPPFLALSDSSSAAPVPADRGARETVPLWPGTPPGGGGPSGPVQISPRGGISHVAMPLLEVFRPQSPNGSAVLVAAGGGYKRIEMRNEAIPAARWLAARGVTAFVLSYRLPTEGWAAGPLAPLQDALRALRLIRAEGKARWGLDCVAAGKGGLGVLGFSAGGHLLGLAAVRAGFAAYPPVDATDALPARPDFAALIYPVVTLLPPYDDTSTRRMLVGEHPSTQQAEEWSVQTYVAPDSPPMFLVQAVDDPISNPENTVILAQACVAAGVPAELHRLPSGGHGFGMGRAGTPGMEWPGWFEAWLRARHVLG